MIYRIEGEKIRARVSTRGAQLMSLYSKTMQMEYMWQGSTEVNCPPSILLFPVCGRNNDARIIVAGCQYPLEMQGFAKDMEFACISESRDSLVLELCADEETLSRFPYMFRLRMSFLLKDDALYEHFTVINEDPKPMYFNLGMHPDFFFPLDVSEQPEDYVITFDKAQELHEYVLDPLTKLRTGEEILHSETEVIKLDSHTFDKGPRMFGNVDSEYVCYGSVRSGRKVIIGTKGFHDLCLWAVPNKPFVLAVEPWCGKTDTVRSDHDWERREGQELILPGESFDRELSFRLE